MDPLADKYPGWSPYNYVFNNTLRLIDINGEYGVEKIGGYTYITFLSQSSAETLGKFVPEVLWNMLTNDNIFNSDVQRELGEVLLNIINPVNDLGFGLFADFVSKGSKYGNHLELILQAEYMIYSAENIYSIKSTGSEVQMFDDKAWVEYSTPKDELPTGKYLRVNKEFLESHPRTGLIQIHSFLLYNRKKIYNQIRSHRAKIINDLLQQRFIYPTYGNPYDGRNPWDEGR